MTTTLHFHDAARLPLPGDNVAIATHRLEAGTTIIDGDQTYTLSHTVLEGHRFAVQPIATSEALLSWELPFGRAISDIAPGSYVGNAGMLEALRKRQIDFALPAGPNFTDEINPYLLDEATFQPADPLPHYEQPTTFMGYRREGGRGVGTRNFIILLGTTSGTGGFVRQLEARLRGLSDAYPNIDGIVAVAHTEGDQANPNNLDLLLRTLAGFMVHSNVGAVLAVDYGSEGVNNTHLQAYLREHNYPIRTVPHHFISLQGSFEESLAQGESIVKGWLNQVNATPRTAESLANLKLVLQCGGSDAFSGISGNPLAAWVAKEIIRSGGAANLAETDELIGAEPYVLQKVRSLETARKFLHTVERFKEWAAWHGHTAEGNPSGGNKFRGLYNIVLKSIGAAMKRHPDVPLDYVIDYGERMLEPGYYFMDSPGNDLESIAGQVASGGNLIYFVTGNGSITNFPFAPTIKIVTTSERYQLLSKDMDVNAGAYLDGTSMDDLGRQTLDLTIAVASGQQSVGEAAGHTQVQLWRNWQQTDAANLEQLRHPPQPSGNSLPIKLLRTFPTPQIERFATGRGYAAEQVGLILPTSLCSGQIARMTADYLNRQGLGQAAGLSRFVALVHTEGCGAGSGYQEELYVRTMLGYLGHPMVKHCLLLEHGCEKTHNDHMRHEIEHLGIDPQSLGWASIQLDGGIEKVTQKIEAWFADRFAQTAPPQKESVGLESLRVGLVSSGPMSAGVASSLSQATRAIVSAGGTVIVPETAGLLSETSFLAETVEEPVQQPSLVHAQPPIEAGFHIMEMPSQHWVETLAGLGATGVDVIIAHLGDYPMQAHPLIPVLQITGEMGMRERYGTDMDLVLAGDTDQWSATVIDLITQTAAGNYTPRLTQQGNIDFQITRGLLGISM